MKDVLIRIVVGALLFLTSPFWLPVVIVGAVLFAIGNCAMRIFESNDL